MRNQRLREDLAARRQPGRHSTPRIPAHLVGADRVEAERLIADLSALVDAGLIVVESHVFGPARYAVDPDLEDAA
jgi:hypothetical protein